MCHREPVATCFSFCLSHYEAVQDIQGSVMYNSASNIQARDLKIVTFNIHNYHE